MDEVERCVILVGTSVSLHVVVNKHFSSCDLDFLYLHDHYYEGRFFGFVSSIMMVRIGSHLVICKYQLCRYVLSLKLFRL